MTRRRLPRSWRGRALPRSGPDTVTWPGALRGRSPVLCLLVLGWLGGGLFASAVATVTQRPGDLADGLVTVTAALAGLLLLVAAGGRDGRAAPAPGEPAPVRVPAQVDRRSRVPH